MEINSSTPMQIYQKTPELLEDWSQLPEYPILSILCTTYNHEKYIATAVEGFIKQQIDFSFEILIHDDASTDNTPSLIRQYQSNYPHLIRAVLQRENQKTNHHSSIAGVMSRGKYIAICEGDDYWIDSQKCKKQIEYLENNPDIIATTHLVKIVDQNNSELADLRYPECPDEYYTLDHYKRGLLPGQTGSIVMRNIFQNTFFDSSILYQLPQHPGDRPLAFLLAAHGKVFVFQKVMSAYRYVSNEGSSFSASVNKGNKRHYSKIKQKLYRKLTEYSHLQIDNQKAVQVVESIYFWLVLQDFLIHLTKQDWRELKLAWSGLRFRWHAQLFALGKLLCYPFSFLTRDSNRLGRSHF